MADLNELFSRLKTQPKNTDVQATGPVISPVRQVMPRGATEQSMSNNLLTLLNINRAQATPRAASAVQSSEPAPQERKTSFPTRLTEGQTQEPPGETQRFLLDLLTKPQTVKTPDLTKTDQAAIDKLTQSFSTSKPSTPQPFPASKPATPQPISTSKPSTPQPKSIFNYVNPFDQLHASSPLNLPEKKTSVAEKMEDLKEQVSRDADAALNAADENKNDEEVVSNWSTAGDEEDDLVEAYNFPMKPFVMLELQPEHSARSFRSTTWTNATPVARLKKEFSHDDRTLVTSSQNHIIYTVVPTEKKPAAGLKIIRQDDGKNKHIWSKNERLCNIQLTSTPSDTILATGVNGTVFYTTISDSQVSAFEEADFEGFTMTPPTSEETTGSTIRTRAKLSNQGTAFAIARGRQIYYILPELAYKHIDTARQVNTTSLLADTNISINTGKASKDFCFSVDDTAFASLDKVGKVKFWDIRALSQATGQLELTEPIHGFSAGALPTKDDKMSPSSVLFIDKERAYSKRIAMRYLLVGFQQNHLLQLWDLGLGKCVQELRFPETANPEASSADGSKGMCSIAYHSKTAMICVGHPGRNSVYFLQLSSPKYNLPNMDQATYLTRLAQGDATIPKPESTAIISGVREFSCSKLGQIRSLDILQQPYSADPADETLFELYLMHSKGVVGIPVSRHDLGWDAKGKCIKPVDAVEVGVITVHQLKTIESSEKVVSKPRIEKKDIPAEIPSKSSTTKPVLTDKNSSDGTSKITKPKASQHPPSTPAMTKVHEPEISKAAEPVVTKVIPFTFNASNIKSPEPVTQLPVITPASYKLPDRASTSTTGSETDVHGKEYVATLTDQFASLYTKLDNDKRVAEAAGAAKQDAMLRLVSSTLTDNVESSLHKIVSTSIEQQVLPAISSQIISTIDRQLSQALSKMVPVAIEQHFQASMPSIISKALKTALEDVVFITSIATEVTKQLDTKIALSIANQTAANEKTNTGLDNLHQSTVKALQDSEQRILQLLTSIQEEQAQLAAKLETFQNTPASSQHEAVKESSEVEHLTQLLDDDEFEQATIEWLQSQQQVQLFDDLFVRINPAYLQRVSPLIALSVSAAVTASFDNNVQKRLEWLSAVLDTMNTTDSETREVMPKILDILVQRLQGAYMQIAESQPTDQDILRKLASLNRQISDIRKVL